MGLSSISSLWSSTAASMVQHGLNVLEKDKDLTHEILAEALVGFQAITQKDLGRFIEAAKVESVDVPKLISDVRSEFQF